MKALLLTALMVMSAGSFADVWKTKKKRKWDAAWEQRYTEWVKEARINQNLFTQGKYKGLPTDCADVVYTMRILFAFENKLPFEIRNPTGSRRFQNLGNTSKMFDYIKNDVKRVIKFASFVGDNVSTYTLARRDAYPVKLDQLQAGDFMVYTYSSINHASFIKEITPFGYMKTLESTTPKKVRTLRALTAKPKLITGGYPWGYLRFKIKALKKSQKKSQWNGQYDFIRNSNEASFEKYFFNLHAKVQPTPDDRIRIDVNNACARLQERVTVVADTLKFVRSKGEQCLGKHDYNNHSTPSRDNAINTEITNAAGGYQAFGARSMRDQNLALAMSYITGANNSREARDASYEICSVEPINHRGNAERSIDLKFFKDSYANKTLSDNPNDGYRSRWALGQGDTSPSCKKY